MSEDKGRSVFALFPNALEDGAPLRADVVVLALPHPKYGSAARYCLWGGALLELQRLATRPSSWFLGEEVESDGALLVGTHVDPLFLLVPLLRTARRRGEAGVDHAGFFCSLSDVLAARSDLPQARLLTRLGSSLATQLAHVCDVKQGWDEKVFRLNDDKSLAWLRAKTEQLARTVALGSRGSYALFSAFGDAGANRVAAKLEPPLRAPDPVADPAGYRENVRLALGVLSEYVAPDEFVRLVASFGFAEREVLHGEAAGAAPAPPSASSSSFASAAPAASATTDDGAFVPAKDPVAAAKRRSGAEALREESRGAKKLKKADTSGIKPLTSYFGKKS
jgi:ribonuclease H2 subunit B